MERLYGADKRSTIEAYLQSFSEEIEEVFVSRFDELSQLNIGEGETSRLVQKLLNAKTAVLDQLKLWSRLILVENCAGAIVTWSIGSNTFAMLIVSDSGVFIWTMFNDFIQDWSLLNCLVLTTNWIINKNFDHIAQV